LNSLCPLVLTTFKMHATYYIVDWIANFLGISWSNEHDVNITAESESVWMDLIKVSAAIYCF
jgi:hypothetical protein